MTKQGTVLNMILPLKAGINNEGQDGNIRLMINNYLQNAYKIAATFKTEHRRNNIYLS
jgi:hypothetical protein